MEVEYSEAQEPPMNMNDMGGKMMESPEDMVHMGEKEEYGDEECEEGFDGGFGGRGARRGGGNFRWMNGPPMRFRGRGYGPGGPPMRGTRGNFFRGRGGGPRFGGGNFDPSWGPMGPPPGMMGGPPPFGPPPGMMGPGNPMGPPPNMMGAPPFGGPPPMGPPPNMGQELWVETKADDGKSYYYHARTRETTWTRPQEGPNVKVVTQAEMEQMAATGQLAGAAGGPPGMMMMGMMPGQMPPGQMPQFIKSDAGSDSPNSQSGAQDKGDMMEDKGGEPQPVPPGFGPPGGFPGGYPGMNGPGNGGVAGAGFPPGWGGGWQPNWPPPMMPPQNMGGGPGSLMPPGQEAPMVMGQPPVSGDAKKEQMFISQPPPNIGMVQNSVPPVMGQPSMGSVQGIPPPGLAQPGMLPSTMQQKGQESNKEDLKSPPADLVAAAKEWSTHKAPNGRNYYYNASKQESVWKKPQALRDLEAWNAQAGIVTIDDNSQGADVEIVKNSNNDSNANSNDKDVVEIIDIDAQENKPMSASVATAVQAAAQAAAEQAEKDKQEREKAEKQKAEKEKPAEKKNVSITKTPIFGTPWSVVWTSDGRVFFHNGMVKESVWECPPALVGRADVEAMVSKPPPSLWSEQQKESAAAKANGTKRTADDSSSESESEPPKKSKQEEVAPEKTLPPIREVNPKESEEAEAKAARERALVPYEQRVKLFREMLEEKQVSAFSNWKNELQKIVFDSRYLILNSKERKQVFDKYVKERADKEMKEKRERLKLKKENFRKLLEQAKLHSKSSFTEFASKYRKDESLTAIEKVRERESMFNEYILELRKKEKEEKDKKREQIKKDFIALLREKEVSRHLRWSEAKKKVDSETRYKAVDSSTLRENYFNEYCRLVKDEKKKEKDVKEKSEKDSSRSSSKKDKKDKDKDKEREKEKKSSKKEKEKASDDEGVDVSAASDVEAAAAREKEARIQASIKEREKEVQKVLANSLRDRDKEREFHKRDEAVQHFNALLADLVRNPDVTWHDTRKQLKKDDRYELSKLLTKEDKERLFTAHTTTLGAKRREKFREMLTELGVSLTARWREVKELAGEDPRLTKYSSMDRCEREFRDFQKDRLAAAKVALKTFLQETKSLTHETAAKVRKSKKALAAIHQTLKHDSRYLILEHIADEREEIITTYLDELEKKGPPPPPTATEPNRSRK